MNNKTQIEIKRIDFNAFDDKTLGWICIEPTIQKMRSKNSTIKSQVYAQLTSGQKSLLLFWILYGHARHGIIQFFMEIDYLLKETDIWIEFNSRFKCFDDNDLLDLIKELRNLYIQERGIFKPDFDLTANDFDKKYNKIIPNSLKQISKYIRNNPNEFVHFTD